MKKITIICSLLIFGTIACNANTLENKTETRDTIIVAEYTGSDFLGSCLTHFKDKAGNEYTFYDANLSIFQEEDNGCGIKEAYQNNTYELTCTYEKQMVYTEDDGDSEYEGWVVKEIKTH